VGSCSYPFPHLEYQKLPKGGIVWVTRPFTSILACHEVLLHYLTPIEGHHIVHYIPIVYHSPSRCPRTFHPIAFSYRQKVPPPSASFVHRFPKLGCQVRQFQPKISFSLFNSFGTQHHQHGIIADKPRLSSRSWINFGRGS
jgi:hypothetical protein